MIHILSWNYRETTNPLLDMIVDIDYEDQKEMALAVGVNLRTLQRKIEKLKDDGDLVVFRFKNNNTIWCIGDDVNNIHDGYEALATARYRKFISIGGNERDFFDCSAQEQENMLVDIPVFTSDMEEAAEDLGYEYLRENHTLNRAKSLPVDDELHIYTEKLWQK